MEWKMDVAVVTLELPRGDSLLEHFLEFQIASTFHFWKAEVEVDANEEWRSKKYEGNLGTQVDWAGIDQNWCYLTD
jgi:hypothetical protein